MLSAADQEALEAAQELGEGLRGPAYLLPLEEITRRTAEAWDRGATEVRLVTSLTWAGCKARCKGQRGRLGRV